MNPNQALWEQGDFTRIARTMRGAGAELVGRLGLGAGERVLDLGCGDGTTAIPAAERGAQVVGVDIARNLVAAGTARAAASGLTNVTFRHGDARDLAGHADDGFDRVVTIFGAMFAPEPHRVASEMVRVTRPGGTITMGNWIPGDPTFVSQLLRISGAYTPPPPEGFVSPVTWGVEEHVVDRFTAAGIDPANISCDRDTWVFDADMPAAAYVDEFRQWYGPTMNAFAAAEADGRADDLRNELEVLFKEHNLSEDPEHATLIVAAYLRVTVQV
ncbi:MAG: class I SAM-dependent methyltransferase [Acidimicrobiia bacterium]